MRLFFYSPDDAGGGGVSDADVLAMGGTPTPQDTGGGTSPPDDLAGQGGGAAAGGADGAAAGDTPPAGEKPGKAATSDPAKPADPTPPNDPAKPADKPAEPDLPKWAQQRVNELTRQMRDEQRAREALEAKLKELEGSGSGDDETPRYTEAQLKAALAEREAMAAAQRANEAFVGRCRDIEAKGTAAMPDFAEKVAALGTVAPPERFRPMMEALLEFDAPEAILYDLGTDLNEAYRISLLPPAQQAAALAKMAFKPKPRAKPDPLVSKAPDPAPRVTGTPPVELDESKMTMAQWMAYMDKRDAARRAVG